MKIITPKGTVDTEKEGIVLLFDDDDQLSAFIASLIETPVRSTGLRVLPLLPDDVELTPLQVSIFNTLKSLDGIGGNDHESICDDAIDSLKDILKDGKTN